MKNLRLLLLIAVFTLGVGGVANAQKIAHINYQRVLANMPETRKMTAEMTKLQKTYKDEIDAFAKKLQDTSNKYKAEQASQTEDTNKKRAAEIQQGSQQLAYAEQAAMQELQNKQREKLTPIEEKAQKAIQEVAKAKGITYVLTTSMLLANNGGQDLYNDVKAKLGLLADLPKPKPQAKK